MDPYSTLEVPHDATIEQIKKAYRKLAKKWHPDANGGSKVAEEKFKNLQAGYDCLSDSSRRASEDLKRKLREEVVAAQRVKAEAERQARAAAYARPSSTHSEGPNWGAVGLAFLALAGIGSALSSTQTPRRRPRPVKRRRRRTR